MIDQSLVRLAAIVIGALMFSALMLLVHYLLVSSGIQPPANAFIVAMLCTILLGAVAGWGFYEVGQTR